MLRWNPPKPENVWNFPKNFHNKTIMNLSIG
jgi:hypothetical protein